MMVSTLALKLATQLGMVLPALRRHELKASLGCLNIPSFPGASEMRVLQGGPEGAPRENLSVFGVPALFHSE